MIPEQGFNNYAQNVIQEVEGYIQKAQISNVNLNLGTFKFQLQDIHIGDISISKIQIVLPDQDQTAILNIDVCQLQFQFTMKQQTYPYLEDQGDGYIYLSNMQVVVYANPFVEPPTEDLCYPYQHLNPNFSDSSSLYIQDIKLIFNSNYSYIYNGIIDLLQDSIKELINEEIGPEFLSSALDAAINGISGGWCVCHCDSNTTYGTGFIYQQFLVENSILKANYSGQYGDIASDNSGVTFYGVNDTDLKIRLMTNSDFMYFIEKQNWETGANFVLGSKLNKTVKCIQYVNTGILMAYGDSVYLVQVHEENNLNSSHDLSILTDIKQYYGCLQDGQIIHDDSNLCQLSDEEMQTVQEFYSVNYLNMVNSYGMGNCDIMYQDDNNMLMSCYQQK